jgi:hypothetical protein
MSDKVTYPAAGNGAPAAAAAESAGKPAATESGFSLFLDTVKTDLEAGESFLEETALEGATILWNVLKTGFIALGPAEAKIAVDVLTKATTDAQGGKSIEEIESDALTTASDEERAVLTKAGSGVVQQIIAGVKANTTNPGVTGNADDGA